MLDLKPLNYFNKKLCFFYIKRPMPVTGSSDISCMDANILLRTLKVLQKCALSD